MTELLGGLGPAVIKSTWIQMFLAILVIGLRAYTASRTGEKWRWDFIWILLALVAGILTGVMSTMSAINGMGNHLANLNVQALYDLLYWEYLSTYLGTLSIAFSKFSVTALLLNVQYRTRNKTRRYALWISAITFAITSLLEIFLTAFQCAPDIKVWMVLDLATCKLEKGARVISYIHAITGGLTDIFLALFPISFVWDLQTSIKIKIGFCALMAVGIIPGIMSFYRFKTLRLIYTAPDVPYALGIFSLWAGVELGSLLILCSIPPLRPLFKKAYNKVSTRARTITGTAVFNRTGARSAYTTKVDKLDQDRLDDLDASGNVHVVVVEAGNKESMV
ncbi:hypothetical protein K461DRAFT_269948 [Myriangium duriaei CBS 260.36]|uniref:Rhodopsin domain-containing protein n=1 Tax=Myriangium duriaei CBS 260.36 TaxID=1168546 RepID=A0A9P4IZG5_9PEZI|nr:hypothetical protein K461DRAFT_269948 [Myriangium duriaei CBS 260.36]